MDITCYLVSRSPSLTLDDKTPHEVWTGNKLSFKHLRVFCCGAYVHVPKENRGKLDKKVEKCTFSGYKDGLNDIRFKIEKLRRLCKIENRDAIFKEIKDVFKHGVIQRDKEHER